MQLEIEDSYGKAEESPMHYHLNTPHTLEQSSLQPWMSTQRRLAFDSSLEHTMIPTISIFCQKEDATQWWDALEEDKYCHWVRDAFRKEL
jgi:hypothetical protein